MFVLYLFSLYYVIKGSFLEGDSMESRLSATNNDRSLYTFYSAKKLYLAHLPQKYILMEMKDEYRNDRRVLSLVSRNAVVVSKAGGMLLYPRSR